MQRIVQRTLAFIGCIVLFSGLALAASKELDLDLVLAAMGNLQEVQQLIAQGANVNGTDSSGTTPLMMAAGSGQYEIADFLISKGANVNAKNQGGMTPLMQAATSGNKELVQLLLSKGADPNAKEKDGYTASYFATLYQHKDLADLLMARAGKSAATGTSAGSNQTQKELDEALRFAVNRDDLARVKELTARGASVKTVFPENHEESLLHAAVKNGNIALADYFIGKGISPNVLNSLEETPLHYAVMFENAPMVKFLLGKGAKPNLQNNEFEAPLYTLTRKCQMNRFTTEQQQIMELLLNKGADINQMNGGETWGGKMTVLHNAAFMDNMTLAEFLLAKGARPTVQNSQGMTPLHFAVNCHSVKMVRLLIGKGANVNTKDAIGHSPLYYAKEAGDTEIVTVLSKAGARE